MSSLLRGSRARVREPFAYSGSQAAREAVGFLRNPDRRVFAVSGPGAARALNGLASNRIDGVAAGLGAYAFLLDRRGRVVVDARILPAPGFEHERASAAGPQTLWLDVPAVGASALAGHLRTYVPPMLATHGPADATVRALLGPRAAETLERWRAATGAEWARAPQELAPLEATTARLGGESLLIARREPIEVDGFDLYASTETPTDALAEAASEEGGGAVTLEDWRVLRVESGLPVLGAELGPDRLAQEAGQDERAISFEKGCFTGQEVVARIHYRGRVNRHLRGLRWTSTAPPPAAPEEWSGLELRAPDTGRTVGVVTSGATSPRRGAIALGYVRRELGPGDAVDAPALAGGTLELCALPFTQM